MFAIQANCFEPYHCCVADEESSKPVVSAFGFETQELFGNQEESISDGEWSEHEYVSVIFILS